MPNAQHIDPQRAAQVRACLDTVIDPELDESVVELGFVTEVELDEAGTVRVAFRLPTYWCAANFAFLMADDMRIAVLTLPWVTSVEVKLHDHMYEKTINDGVACGNGFAASFGAAAEGGLENLRQTFLQKAFQRRQAALLHHLLEAGHAGEALAAMPLEALRALPLAAEGQRLVARHLQRRSVPGDKDPAAFVDLEGCAFDAQALQMALREAQRVEVNATFNGALCRGLQAARYGEAAPQPIHFMPRRVATATH